MKSSNVHTEYIKMLEKVKKNKEVLDENTSELNNIIDTSNNLFSNIENTSDLKIDAKISSIYSEVYLKLFQKKLIGKTISVDKFTRFFNSDQSKLWFNCFKRSNKSLRFISFIDFNYMVVKKTRKCERLKIEIKEAETPIENNKITEDVKSEFLIRLINSIKQGRHVPYYKTVLNSDSFSKTVENVFHLSLAIRSKEAMLVVKDDNVFITEYKKSEKVYNEHVIEEFDFQRYLYLKRKYLSIED